LKISAGRALFENPEFFRAENAGEKWKRDKGGGEFFAAAILTLPSGISILKKQVHGQR
jgi:hypothetical protein